MDSAHSKIFRSCVFQWPNLQRHFFNKASRYFTRILHGRVGAAAASTEEKIPAPNKNIRQSDDDSLGEREIEYKIKKLPFAGE